MRSEDVLQNRLIWLPVTVTEQGYTNAQNTGTKATLSIVFVLVLRSSSLKGFV